MSNVLACVSLKHKLDSCRFLLFNVNSYFLFRFMTNLAKKDFKQEVDLDLQGLAHPAQRVIMGTIVMMTISTTPSQRSLSETLKKCSENSLAAIPLQNCSALTPSITTVGAVDKADTEEVQILLSHIISAIQIPSAAISSILSALFLAQGCSRLSQILTLLVVAALPHFPRSPLPQLGALAWNALPPRQNSLMARKLPPRRFQRVAKKLSWPLKMMYSNPKQLMVYRKPYLTRMKVNFAEDCEVFCGYSLTFKRG